MAVTLTKELETTIMLALEEAKRRKHEFLMLEHVLHAMTRDRVSSMILKACGATWDCTTRSAGITISSPSDATSAGPTARFRLAGSGGSRCRSRSCWSSGRPHNLHRFPQV